VDKAGPMYWERHWISTSLPKAVDHLKPGLRNYVNKRFHEYFHEKCSNMETSEMTLLEIGCARSIWLSYFAKEFGFNVSGIDYSPKGCEQARKALFDAGTQQEIICADFFAPPEWMIKRYDVIISFGVAEHFQDTQACIAAFAKFLKPGGTIITIIPNMVGLVGKVQKLINKSLFDIHVQLNPNDLCEAHQASGLKVLDCSYFLFTNFGVCNVGERSRGTIRWLLSRVIVAALSHLSMGVWLIEEFLPVLKPNKFTSPYITCIARQTLTD
jgi:2-polyprenyl-3-methyl-5-hydroxy-6-metoxy-1,4-benzoquinol methylase